MHYDDKDVVVVYTLVKNYLGVLRDLRVLRILYGIPSNNSSIVIVTLIRAYTCIFETRVLSCKPRSDSESETSIRITLFLR